MTEPDFPCTARDGAQPCLPYRAQSRKVATCCRCGLTQGVQTWIDEGVEIRD